MENGFSILPHLAIEFLNGTYKQGVLLEDSMSRKRRTFVFESYGVFNGCEDIADELMEHISKEHQDMTSEIFHSKKSFFFNKVRVVYTNSIKGMSYVPRYSKIGKNGRFECIVITVGLDDKEGLKSRVMHELQHAYEDWKLRKRGESFFSKKESNGYFENNKAEPKESYLKKIKWALYFLDSSEINAYITEMVNEVNEINGEFVTIKDVSNVLLKVPTYVFFQKVFRFVEYVKMLKDVNKQNVILNYVNSVIPGKFNTYNQFAKWLWQKASKAKRKIDNVLSKAVYEHFKDKMMIAFPSLSNEEMKDVMEEFDFPLDYDNKILSEVVRKSVEKVLGDC